jgi:hypothetical protein
VGAWVLNGEVPDLRHVPSDVYQQFNSAVLGGSHIEQGIPRFSNPPRWPLIKTAMTQEEADALHDDIID